MFHLGLPVLTLTMDPSNLRCLSRTTLAFRLSPDYGSGGGDVIEGCRETLRGRELVRVDLCHAALGDDS
jgi:hypothetical protein